MNDPDLLPSLVLGLSMAVAMVASVWIFLAEPIPTKEPVLVRIRDQRRLY